MDPNAPSRKRKDEEEIEASNQALRQALGKRPAPPPPKWKVVRPSQAALTTTKKTDGKVKKDAPKPSGKSAAEIAALRRRVDERVEKWKGSQGPGGQAGQLGAGRASTSAQLLGSRRPEQAEATPVADPPGFFRRFVDEDPTNPSHSPSATGTARMKAWGHGMASLASTGSNRKRPVAGDEVRVKKEPEDDDVASLPTVAREKEGGVNKEVLSPVGGGRGKTADQGAWTGDDDESSDDGAILEVVDTTKPRRARERGE